MDNRTDRFTDAVYEFSLANIHRESTASLTAIRHLKRLKANRHASNRRTLKQADPMGLNQ